MGILPAPYNQAILQSWTLRKFTPSACCGFLSYMEFEYLDLTKTRFETAPDGTLRVTVEDDSCATRVEALRAFPLSHPDEHIVLRDGGGREVGIVQHLRDLPTEARAIIEAQLHRRYFLPQIQAIYAVSERFGSSVWDIETDRGRREVSMGQINEAISEVEPGRYLLTDVEGNRYEVKDLSELDTDSRARFLGKI